VPRSGVVTVHGPPVCSDIVWNIFACCCDCAFAICVIDGVMSDIAARSTKQRHN
jgi:hypothetical protein